MLKRILTTFLGSAPLWEIGACLFRYKPLVVLYHGVTSNTLQNGIENYRGKHIPTDIFEGQLIWLKHHFDIVPLHIIETLVRERKVPEKPLCAITFDDGYRNNFTTAFPILKRCQAPATIFLTTGFLERGSPLWTDALEMSLNVTKRREVHIIWPDGETVYPIETFGERRAADIEIRDKLKVVSSVERELIIAHLLRDAHLSPESVLNHGDYIPLSWEDVEEMKDNGITFGAHTHTHPILSRELREVQCKEIALSLEKLRGITEGPLHFAYPNGQPGDWNEESKTVLKEMGVRFAWTTRAWRVETIDDDPLELPRITLDDTINAKRFRALASNTLPLGRSIL